MCFSQRKYTLFPYYILLLAGLVLVTSSCKKEEQGELRISWSSPDHGSSYLHLQELSIRACIAASPEISSVNLRISGPEFSSTLLDVNPGGESYTFSEVFIFDSTKHNFGEYRIIATVSNSESEQAFERRVVFSRELPPPEGISMVLINNPDPNTCNLRLIDGEGKESSTYTLNADYGLSVANSGVLFFAGALKGDLQRINLNDGSKSMLLENRSVGSQPYFTGLYLDDLNQVICGVSGVEKLYHQFNSSGSSVMTGQLSQDRSFHFHRIGEWLFSAEQNASSGAWKITEYRVSTGGFNTVHGFSRNGGVSGLFSFGDLNALYIVSGDGNSTNIDRLNRSDNSLSFIKGFDGTPINENPVYINKSEVLLATSAAIYHLSENQNWSTWYDNVANVERLRYDATQDLVGILDGGKIKLIRFTDGVQVGEIAVSADVKDFHFISL
jgi:hypothetical protein